VLTVAHRAPLGMNASTPAARALPSVLPNDSRPRKSRDDQLDPIAYLFLDAASGTAPHQVGVQVTARFLGPEITPARSSAVAATALTFTEFFGLLGSSSLEVPFVFDLFGVLHFGVRWAAIIGACALTGAQVVRTSPAAEGRDSSAPPVS
jgi:hypothetical protein